MTMIAQILSRPTLRSQIGSFLKALVARRPRETSTDDDWQDSLIRRELLLEMLDRSPEAFHSEMDIQHMAHLYRSRF